MRREIYTLDKPALDETLSSFLSGVGARIGYGYAAMTTSGEVPTPDTAEGEVVVREIIQAIGEDLDCLQAGPFIVPLSPDARAAAVSEIRKGFRQGIVEQIRKAGLTA